MKENRFHEMTYGEIDKMYRAMEADRDRWVQLVKDLYIAVREAPQAGNDPSPALVEMMGKVHSAVRETLLSQNPRVESMKESLGFVVDMMNSGKVNARDVYPEGRYQGD